MLTLTDAWTNEAAGGSGFALWFAADDPDDYTADSGRTLTMTGPKDGGRSAYGMGGTRGVG